MYVCVRACVKRVERVEGNLPYYFPHFVAYTSKSCNFSHRGRYFTGTKFSSRSIQL